MHSSSRLKPAVSYLVCNQLQGCKLGISVRRCHNITFTNLVLCTIFEIVKRALHRHCATAYALQFTHLRTLSYMCRHHATVCTPVHHTTVHTPHIVLHMQASCYSSHTCTSCYSLYTCASCYNLYTCASCYSLHTCTACCSYTPAHSDMCRHHATVYTPAHHATVYTPARHATVYTPAHHATVYTPAHFVIFPRSEWLSLLLLVASPFPLLLSLSCLPLYGYGCPAILQFQKTTTAKKNQNYSGLSRIYMPCMTPADFLITWWVDRLMQSTDAGVVSTWNQLVHRFMSVVLCVCCVCVHACLCVMLQHKLHSWPMWSIIHQLWMWFYLGRRNGMFFMCTSDCRLPEFSENPKWSCQLLCRFDMEWLRCKMKAWS